MHTNDSQIATIAIELGTSGKASKESFKTRKNIYTLRQSCCTHLESLIQSQDFKLAHAGISNDPHITLEIFRKEDRGSSMLPILPEDVESIRNSLVENITGLPGLIELPVAGLKMIAKTKNGETKYFNSNDIDNINYLAGTVESAIIVLECKDLPVLSNFQEELRTSLLFKTEELKAREYSENLCHLTLMTIRGINHRNVKNVELLGRFQDIAQEDFPSLIKIFKDFERIYSQQGIQNLCFDRVLMNQRKAKGKKKPFASVYTNPESYNKGFVHAFSLSTQKEIKRKKKVQAPGSPYETLARQNNNNNNNAVRSSMPPSSTPMLSFSNQHRVAVNPRVNVNAAVPFLNACASAELQAVRNALTDGADINVVGGEASARSTGLQLAILLNNPGVMQVVAELLQRPELDISNRNAHGLTALQMALSHANNANNSDTVRQAWRDIAHRISDLPMNVALLNAAAGGNLAAVQQALIAGADINAINGTGGGAYNALQLAIQYNQPHLISHLISEGADLEYRGNSQQLNAIELAANKPEIAEAITMAKRLMNLPNLGR